MVVQVQRSRPPRRLVKGAEVAGNRKKRGPRQFSADIYDGDCRLASQVAVELWTKNMRCWRGQLLFLAQGDVQAGKQYTLRADREHREILVVDLTIIRGLCWVLFEQLPTEPADSASHHTNGHTNGVTEIMSLPLDLWNGRLLRAAPGRPAPTLS